MRNVFEAGRRITHLVAFVAAIIGGLAILDDSFAADTVGGTIFAVIFIYSASWAIGWVLRGLWGIRSGQDFVDD